MQHKTPRVSKGRRLSVAIALSSAALVLLAGCASGSNGGSSGGSGSVPQEVTDKLAKYSEAQPFDFKGAAFDVSSVNGKNVWWVLQDATNPFLTTVSDMAKQALATVGVTITTCDGKSNPVDANNCISQGVAQNAAAIQVDGPDPASIGNSATAAQSAGIPVLVGAGVDAAANFPSYITGGTSQPFGLSGELAADFAIVDAKGAANVLVITTPDVIGSGVQAKAFEAELKKYCPSCKFTEQGVNLGQWATDLGTTTSAALTKDPTINYVFPVFDPMTQFVNPAITQAGKASTVKVVTVNGILPFMQDLATGTSVTQGEVGQDLQALGYIEADQILRALTGNPLVPNDYAPARFFDAKAAKALTLTPDAWLDGSWYGGSGSNAKLFSSIWKK